MKYGWGINFLTMMVNVPFVTMFLFAGFMEKSIFIMALSIPGILSLFNGWLIHETLGK
jgi:hypothetical protein